MCSITPIFLQPLLYLVVCRLDPLLSPDPVSNIGVDPLHSHRDACRMSDSTPNLYKIFAVFLLLALLAVFFTMIAGFLSALVFAASSALMFYPLQKRLEKRLAPNFAAMINLLLLLAVIIVPAIFLFGLAVSQALSVVDQASTWIGDRLNSDVPFAGIQFPSWLPFSGELDDIKQEITGKAGQIAGAVGRFLVQALQQVTQATALFLLDLFIAAYFFFYCLVDGERLVGSLVASLPLDQEGRDDLVDVSSTVIRSVLKSMVVIGVVQGFLSGLAFWVVGVNGYVFWGIVMGLLSVIPFIGPIIIWLPVAAYLAVLGEYWQAVFLAAWFWLVVASVDNVLRPRLVGSDTQMPDVLVLLTTIGGLFLFGAIGLIVGPLIGALLMAAWAVYRREFAEELALNSEQATPAASPGPNSVQREND